MESKQLISKTARWAKSYSASLHRYIASGPKASRLPALRLGRRAVGLGMETLDVARIHAQAVARIKAPALLDRARAFSDEAIAPIEETHRAARKGDARVNALTRTLSQRTREASATPLKLARDVFKRQTAEAAPKKSKQSHRALSAEANRLKKDCRTLLNKNISEHEAERQKTSIQLQDDFVQTLIAINLKLLTMKATAKASADHLKIGIDETQQLVKDFRQRIKQLARNFGERHAT